MHQEAFLELARSHADFDWLDDAVRYVADTMEHDGSHDFGHLLRVLRNAAAICDGERAADRSPDWSVVVAAALMHDIVNLPKDHPERAQASSMSADKAVAFFADHDVFDDEQLDMLADAIRTHSFSAGLEPGYLESEIVRDADRLEALGAVGLARCFQVSGMLDRAIIDMEDPWADERELDDYEFAVDHFFTKLLGLEASFSTRTGRKMASQRTEFIRTFADQLDSELDPTSEPGVAEE
ncbi:MAG: HD domain-containing protein [Myxococcota bacterium]